MPTVLIVDDHAEFRRDARALLEGDGFEIVGEAVDGATALAGVETFYPELVLLDVQLPDLDGFFVAARIAERRDPPRVVLISTRDAGEYRRRLKDSAAHGFIAKSDLTGAALRALLG